VKRIQKIQIDYEFAIMDAKRCVFCEKTFEIDKLAAHLTAVHSRFRNFILNDGSSDFDWGTIPDLCPSATYEAPILPGQTLLPTKPDSIHFNLSLDPEKMRTACATTSSDGGRFTQQDFMSGVLAIERACGERATMEKEAFINALIKYLCTHDATDKVAGTGGVDVSFISIIVDEQGNAIPSGYQEKYISWKSVLEHFDNVVNQRDFKATYRRIARGIAPLIRKAINENAEIKKFSQVGTPMSNHFSIDPQYWWVALSFATDVVPASSMSDAERTTFQRVARMKYAEARQSSAFDSRPGNVAPDEMRSPAARAMEETLHDARFGSRARAFSSASNPMRFVREHRGRWGEDYPDGS